MLDQVKLALGWIIVIWWWLWLAAALIAIVLSL